MQAPELKVAIAPPRVVELVGICDLCDNRARVFCKRVEENAVGDDGNDLGFSMLASPNFGASKSFSFRNCYMAQSSESPVLPIRQRHRTYIEDSAAKQDP